MVGGGAHLPVIEKMERGRGGGTLKSWKRAKDRVITAARLERIAGWQTGFGEGRIGETNWGRWVFGRVLNIEERR